MRGEGEDRERGEVVEYLQPPIRGVRQVSRRGDKLRVRYTPHHIEIMSTQHHPLRHPFFHFPRATSSCQGHPEVEIFDVVGNWSQPNEGVGRIECAVAALCQLGCLRSERLTG